MYPTTPPVTDYSRPRLRQIAVWIRDELDPVIARDGPEILRADDVLMLHEMFYALRHSQTISALDLRATGIHRAVMEVAGTATRWPGRLADDCDKIILVWQKKFGALENLRPFMYGRAGRLEGIASATEFSKGALIQRWQKLCPQKILSERSHSTGDLGFSAGSWWINPLFAHHAGIIDLDTTDGGICHDNYGAYAVFLKETGEIEALSEESITYRCSPDDKGRFRLTSAVSRGRIRIRILRSHSLDSIWGPKAGVRYEGLYRVSGWTIRPVKTGDFGGPEHKVGDLMYEIKFERDDPVPMTEVMRHPTTFELDDYTEYKRLRRMQHEGSQKPTVERVETPGPAKVAAHIPSLTAPFTQLHPLSQTRNNPGPSRSPTLRYPLATIAGSAGPSRSPSDSVANPEIESSFGLSKNTLGVPVAAPKRMGTSIQHGRNDSPKSDLSSKSTGSSVQVVNSNLEEIREVTPWVEFDAAVTSMSPLSTLRASVHHDPIRNPSHDDTTIKSQTVRRDHSPDSRATQSSQGKISSPYKTHGNSQNNSIWELRLPSSTRQKEGEKDDNRKSTIMPFARTKNPLAKLFDGTEKDYFNYQTPLARAASVFPKRTTRIEQRRFRSSSSDAILGPLSPIPVRPMSPASPLINHRRDAIIHLPYDLGLISVANPSDTFDMSGRASTASKDPFIDGRTLARPRDPKSPSSVPMSLKDFISKPQIASPVSVSPAFGTRNGSPGAVHDIERRRQGEQRENSEAETQLRGIFKDPFKVTMERDARDRGRKGKEGVERLAPHEVA